MATAGGLAPLVSVVGAAGVNGLRRTGGWRATALGCGGLGAAGLVDDLFGERLGTGGARGLGGHLAELRRGRVTTGMVKVVVGVGSGAAAVAAGSHRPSPLQVLEGGAVVALAGNLGNLLDRAPARTTKVALLAATCLLAVDRLASGPAFAVGATAATLPQDLAEKVMLGDTGANLVGAALGVALVDGSSSAGRHAALALLLALTAASEQWSFSQVIAETAPLDWADRLGRLPS